MLPSPVIVRERHLVPAGLSPIRLSRYAHTAFSLLVSRKAAVKAIKRGEITHGPDAAFSAHVLNAIPRMNEQGFTLSKGKSRGKIDAAVALCIAFHRANSRGDADAAGELWASFG